MIAIFPGNKVAINLDRIDGIVYSEKDQKTCIYVGGNSVPFIRIEKTMQEVADIINKAEMRGR